MIVGPSLPNFSSAGLFSVNSVNSAPITGAFQTLADTIWTGGELGASSIFFQGTLPYGDPTHTRGQDMITALHGNRRFETPEPVTMSLGFAAVGLFVRRRMKAKKG